jgi:hypothetical protein
MREAPPARGRGAPKNSRRWTRGKSGERSTSGGSLGMSHFTT